MATLLEKIKLLDKKEQQFTFTDRVQRLEVKNEHSVVRSCIEIFLRQQAQHH